MSRQMPVEDDETAVDTGRGRTVREAMQHPNQQDVAGIPSDFQSLKSGYEELSVPPELQISASTPDPPPSGLLWSDDVLCALSGLSDFTSSETEILQMLLETPPTVPVACVREFFLELQRQMSGRLQLRNVSEQLKRLRRCDVVTAAHRQRDLLRWLGPVLPEELPIKHMKPSLWSRFTTALSVTTSPGSDWRGLARTLRIPQSYVELWQQRSSNPAEMVLRAWEGKATEATAGRLFDILMEMGREDLTGML
ncbi:uncharacterized protein LOC128503599 isoform X1 [Spea bombifrons]|uniref:uncharacterized protein LOC128503599 isoform X1 n=1 Tax=Spea bombifrons TaxID=233779 RepID=UPI00234B5D43|nr:uncharacterized protein LOC128503599 isoform X1 [Spea bombifrons]